MILLTYVEVAGECVGKSRALPQDEQDAIASQIPAPLADEDAWKKRFTEKRDVSVVWHEKPLRKTRGVSRCRSTICVDSVPDHPAHPGLQFKKLEGEDDIYSVRIGLGYRALTDMKEVRIVWYWIGNHSEYDRLV